MAQHISELNSPSSGAFSSCMLQIWYVLEYKLGMYEWWLRYGCKIMNKVYYGIVRYVRLCMIVWWCLNTTTRSYSLKTLLRMDYWGPKHVQPPNVIYKLNHKTLCILLDYIYIKSFVIYCPSSFHTFLLRTFPLLLRSYSRAPVGQRQWLDSVPPLVTLPHPSA